MLSLLRSGEAFPFLGEAERERERERDLFSARLASPGSHSSLPARDRETYATACKARQQLRYKVIANFIDFINQSAT